MQIDQEKSQALLDAVRPFVQAAGLGWQVKEAVRQTDLRDKGLSKLIAVDAYAGVHTAQSNVSWADWQRLLDAWVDLMPPIENGGGDAD